MPNQQQQRGDGIGDPPNFAASPDYLARGLSGAEIADRIARGQVNRVPRSAWRDYLDIVIRNTVTLFNALVVPAAVALFILGDYRAAWAVSAYAVINSLIGLIQEFRAKHHLEKLALHAALKVRVLRAGESRVIAADDLVKDDHVQLSAGETIAADGLVLIANSLEMDEALLTGESDPVPRNVGDRVLSGSVCVAGAGAYRADQVGVESFAQQTSIQARHYRFAPSPMQRIVDTIIRVLTVTAVALCVLYVGMYFVEGFPQAQLWQMIAATVTSMVPQGLVLMTTLTFTLGAVRMSRRGAVVQRLNAVESMASVDVICMDKTGTLTTNELRLAEVRAIDAAEDEVKKRLRLFAWTAIDSGSRFVQAIRSAVGSLQSQANPQVIEQTPFKSQNRFSAVRLCVNDEELTLVAGAFEALKPRLAESGSSETEKIWREMLPSGLRLVLFADSRGSSEAGPLRPLALLGLSDQLRPEASSILELLADQGINFKILSGDHPDTIRATIGELHLPLAHDAVVTEEKLDSAPDRARIIEQGTVFGRVTPRRKVEIVAALQSAGRQVGMVGDGINDILAIKRANLGIAMGSGASATKTVAALVLENNDFSLLPVALYEGRTILRNLRRVSKIFLLKNVYSLFLIVFGLGLLGLEFPYLPQQVTLLNTLTIGGPAFLMMFSKPSVKQPARAGFLREVGSYVLAAGLIIGLAGLLVWTVSAKWLGDEVDTRRTLLLTTLILLGLGNLLVIAWRAIWVRWWTVAAVLVYLGVMYLPPTAHFFVLTPLTITQWLSLIAVAAAAFIPCALAGRFLACGDEGD